MYKWDIPKPRRRRKEVRKFKKEKKHADGYNWDLGVVAFGLSKKSKNNDKICK